MKVLFIEMKYKHFHDDPVLVQVLGIQQMPKASALGNWLRRMGNNGQGLASLSNVNKGVLKVALHHCKEITLDMDATEIISHKADAPWTYNKNQGYIYRKHCHQLHELDG